MHSFVVRLWRERNGKGQAWSFWRGTIDHVGSETRHYFNELEGMIGFIRRRIHRESGPENSLWQWIVERGRRLVSRS